MSTQDMRLNAIEHAKQAVRWIGDEPVTVSAPVDAQVATAYAVLALVEQVRALTSEVYALRQGCGRP